MQRRVQTSNSFKGTSPDGTDEICSSRDAVIIYFHEVRSLLTRVRARKLGVECNDLPDMQIVMSAQPGFRVAHSVQKEVLHCLIRKTSALV